MRLHHTDEGGSDYQKLYKCCQTLSWVIQLQHVIINSKSVYRSLCPCAIHGSICTVQCTLGHQKEQKLITLNSPVILCSSPDVGQMPHAWKNTPTVHPVISMDSSSSAPVLTICTVLSRTRKQNLHLYLMERTALDHFISAIVTCYRVSKWRVSILGSCFLTQEKRRKNEPCGILHNCALYNCLLAIWRDYSILQNFNSR